eukprot:918760_1
MSSRDKYYCKFSWVIDSKLLNRIVKATNEQSFVSAEFEIDQYKGHIELCGDRLPVNVTLRPSAKSDARRVGYRGKIDLVELELNETVFIPPGDNCIEVFLAGDYILDEIRSANLDTLTIIVEIQILHIVESRYCHQNMIYQRPLSLKGSFKEQHITWQFDESLMQEMRYSKFFGKESPLFNQMWSLKVQKTYSGIGLYLQSYGFPPNVSEIDFKWRIYADALHVNETITAESFACGDTSKLDKISSFEAFTKHNSINFDVNIAILRMRGIDGKEVQASKWKEHIVTQQTDKITETKFTWQMDKSLLTQMKAAEQQQYFSTNTFILGGMEMQLNAYPLGKEKDTDTNSFAKEFCIVAKPLSPIMNCTDMRYYTKITCDELDFIERNVSEVRLNKHGQMSEFEFTLPMKWTKEENQLTVNVEFEVLQKYIVPQMDHILYQYPLVFEQPFKNQQFEWVLNGKLLDRMKKHGSYAYFDSPTFKNMWCLSLKRKAQENEEKDETDSDDAYDETDTEDDERCDDEEETSDHKEGQNISDYNLAVRLSLSGSPFGIHKVKVKWSIFCDEMNKSKITTNEVSTWNYESAEYEAMGAWDEFMKYTSLTFYVSLEILNLYDANDDIIEPSEWDKYINEASKLKEICVDIKEEFHGPSHESMHFIDPASDDEDLDYDHSRFPSTLIHETVEDDSDCEASSQKTIDAEDKWKIQMHEEMQSLRQQVLNNNMQIKQMKKQLAKLPGNVTDDEEHKDISNEDKVRIWLEDTVQLAQYSDLLINDGYDDLETIADLTMQDLINVGIDKSGHRKKIVKYAQKLRDINVSNVEIEGVNIRDTAK